MKNDKEHDRTRETMKRIMTLHFCIILLFGLSCTTEHQTTIESMGKTIGVEIKNLQRDGNFEHNRIQTEEHLRQIGYVQ